MKRAQIFQKPMQLVLLMQQQVQLLQPFRVVVVCN